MSSPFVRAVVTLALYVAVNMVLAVSWHLVLFKDVLAEATPFARDEPIIALGFAAMLLHGVLLTGIYPRFHRPDSPMRSGAIFGGLTGLFLAAGAIWVEVGKFRFNGGTTYLIVETIYEIASFAALGVLIALRYRPTASS
jgi:hypothetical protein